MGRLSVCFILLQFTVGVLVAQSLSVNLPDQLKICDFWPNDAPQMEAEVSGGQGPYTYEWTDFENWIQLQDVLSETNSLHPEIVGLTVPTNSWWDPISDWVTVRLTVTDSLGQDAWDEMELMVCSMTIIPEPVYSFVTIGDTITFTAVREHSCLTFVAAWEPVGCEIISTTSRSATAVITEKTARMKAKNADPHGCFSQTFFSFVSPSEVFAAPLTVDGPQTKDLRLFPNPNKGEFTISNLATGSELAIFNTTGTLVAKRYANSSTISMEESLTPGIYLIQVSGHAETLRLVITP